MAKNSVNDYDQTAGNNTDVASVNIAEGCPPSNINNGMRAMMAHIAAAFQGGVTTTSVKAAALAAQTATHTFATGTTASYTALVLGGTALGTAATKATGTSSGQVPLMDGTGYPAANGSQITALNGSNIASGTVAAARLATATTSAQGAVQLADQTAMEAGTSGRAVTADVAHFHPSAAKFWVKGINTTVNASYNVTSITDNAQGDWTVTIANDLSSANYAFAGLALETSAAGDVTNLKAYAQAAGTIRIVCYNESGSLADPDAFCVVGFGDI